MPHRGESTIRVTTETLLVDFWYAHNVGHAVEALRYCAGYRHANPGMRIGLALNGRTPVELGRMCAAVDAVYPIQHDFPGNNIDPAPALASVPRDWDWVIEDSRRIMPEQRAAFPGVARYHDVAGQHYRPRLGRGFVSDQPPAYEPHLQLTLDLPAAARSRAARVLGDASFRIAVMPAGSGARWLYPSVRSWQRIIGALAGSHPDAALCFLGKLGIDERTSTAFGRQELNQLLAACPGSHNGFDAPLVDQLALVEACDLFLSPHTGFGMAALAVGTPWLSIAGNSWPEYFFNGVPFYSSLPDPSRFPCYTGFAEPPAIEQDRDGEGRRSLSLSADRIEADLEEIVEAATALVERRLTYEDAMRSHFHRLLRFHGGDANRIWSIDDIHLRYI